MFKKLYWGYYNRLTWYDQPNLIWGWFDPMSQESSSTNLGMIVSA